MSRKLVASCVLLVLCLALAGPAMARPQWCEIQCTPSTPSYIVCACQTAGAPVISCGEWEEDMCGLFSAPKPQASLEAPVVENNSTDPLPAVEGEADEAPEKSIVKE